MCLGSGARDANKAALAQYQHELAVRERNWMDTLAITSVERVQYEQGIDASNIGLQNFYADMQGKYGDLIGQAMQADEKGWKNFLHQSEGAKMAASGQTGRSAQRISSVEFGQYLAESSRKAYMLMQAKREMSRAGAQKAAATRAQQMQMFAQNAIIKSPDLAPPKPAMQNVAWATFNDALSIATSAASIATPFAIAAASSKKLKDNIIKIGKSNEGHNIYKFNYKGDTRRYVGVIAEEVQQIKPEAVVTMPNGFLGVKYDLIDVPFKEIPA